MSQGKKKNLLSHTAPYSLLAGRVSLWVILICLYYLAFCSLAFGCRDTWSFIVVPYIIWRPIKPEGWQVLFVCPSHLLVWLALVHYRSSYRIMSFILGCRFSHRVSVLGIKKVNHSELIWNNLKNNIAVSVEWLD